MVRVLFWYVLVGRCCDVMLKLGLCIFLVTRARF